MSDSDSSDDLGLFSFANKKKIVTKLPNMVPSVNDKSNDQSDPKDKNLFRKRKRFNPPSPSSILKISDSSSTSAAIHSNDTGIDDSLNIPSPEITPEKKQKNQIYDMLVDNICKVDDIDQIVCQPVKMTKKFQKSVAHRMQLASNLDGVLHRLKSNIHSVLPEAIPTELPDQPQARSFLLKMKKGNNIHRFKIKYDTPLLVALEHLTPIYNTTPDHIIIQLKDEQIDSSKTPQQLGLTVADIIEVLISTETQQVRSGETEGNAVDIITIKIQSTEHRNNVKEYQVIKNKPLTEYLYKACQDFSYGAAKYFFDGDPIDPRKSPSDLDIENLDCIDIVQQT